MNSGVYKITNAVNGIIYIGSSVNLELRKYSHFNFGRHNSYLKNAIKKYGIYNFNWTVIEYCEPYDCINREQYYFDKLLFAQEYINSNHADKRFRELSYNINPTAGSSFGKEVSDQTKLKQSKLRSGKKISNETRFKMSESAKIRIARMGNPMLGKKHSQDSRHKISLNNNRNRLGKPCASASIEKTRKPVIQLDLRGNIICEFKSIQIAANSLKLIRGSIGNVLRGRSQSAGGYKWKYANVN